MKRKVLLLVVFGVLALSVAAPAALATTAPAVNMNIIVTISDKATTFSASVGRRGWAAHFIIQNVGKQTHRIAIGGLKTPPIKPGKRSRLGAYLEDRGQFKWAVDEGGPNQSGFFTVV
jgi:hypothetical protein